MRFSNDRFKSTVYRVYNRSTVDRYSIFFPFDVNFNEKCGALVSYIDENNPPKYKPISYGDWCQLRF
jgi:isopenicillin N synthase-like dioxygenase